MPDPYAPRDLASASSTLGLGTSRLRQRRTKQRRPNYPLRRLLGALLALGIVIAGGMAVADVFRQALTAPEVMPACDPPDRINVLVVGIDPKPLPVAAEGADKEKGPRRQADTLMVFSLDPKATRGYVLSLPRETHATLGQAGEGVLGDALALGGLPMVRDTVEQLTGLTLQHHIALDLDAARDILNQLGPAELHLNQPIRVEEPGFGLDLSREAGWNTLQPDDVLAYAFQRTEDELDRLERQQMLVSLWQRKLHESWNVAWVTQVTSRATTHLETDLTKQDFEIIASKWRAIEPHDLSFAMLPGVANARGEWLLAPARWESLLARLQHTPQGEGPAQSHPTLELLYDDKDDARVAAAAAALQEQGFQVVRTAQVPQATDETLIIDRPEARPGQAKGATPAPVQPRSAAVIAGLMQALGTARVEVTEEANSAYGARLTVRLGKRFFAP